MYPWNGAVTVSYYTTSKVESKILAAVLYHNIYMIQTSGGHTVK